MLVAQSCPTVCDPMNGSPPGSTIHEVLQQEYWSGLPFPSPGDLPILGIKPRSPSIAGGFLTSATPGKGEKVQSTFSQLASAQWGASSTYRWMKPVPPWRSRLPEAVTALVWGSSPTPISGGPVPEDTECPGWSELMRPGSRGHR